MTVALISLALGLAAAPPEAAFIARVYLPGKTRSHYEAYLWRGSDKRAKQLTSSNGECAGLTWLDKNTLAWYEYVEDGRRLVEYAVATSTRKVVSHEAVKDFFVPMQGADAYDPTTTTVNHGDFFARVTLKSKEMGIGYNEVERDGRLERAYVVAENQPPIFQDSSDGESTVFQRGGKEFRLRVDSAHPIYLPGRNKDETVYASGEFAASAGSTGRIWLIDWKLGAANKIIDGPVRVRLDLESGWWWGIMDDKRLGPINGRRREWDTKGKIGNWKTREEWILVEKTSVVSEIAFRPSR